MAASRPALLRKSSSSLRKKKDMNERALDASLKKGQSALIIIDMQRYFAVAGRGIHLDVDPERVDDEHAYLFERLETCIPAIQDLLKTCRSKMEVIFTFLECLTHDGRDQSEAFKQDGYCVPRGSPDADVIRQLAPYEDDIMIPKTSYNVFNSTSLEYILRNLGVKQLVVAGLFTNTSVEACVRDAADRGFHVTLVEDACSARSIIEHENAVMNMGNIARVLSHSHVMEEIAKWK